MYDDLRFFFFFLKKNNYFFNQSFKFWFSTKWSSFSHLHSFFFRYQKNSFSQGSCCCKAFWIFFALFSSFFNFSISSFKSSHIFFSYSVNWEIFWKNMLDFSLRVERWADRTTRLSSRAFFNEKRSFHFALNTRGSRNAWCERLSYFSSFESLKNALMFNSFLSDCIFFDFFSSNSSILFSCFLVSGDNENSFVMKSIRIMSLKKFEVLFENVIIWVCVIDDKKAFLKSCEGWNWVKIRSNIKTLRISVGLTSWPLINLFIRVCKTWFKQIKTISWDRGGKFFDWFGSWWRTSWICVIIMRFVKIWIFRALFQNVNVRHSLKRFRIVSYAFVVGSWRKKTCTCFFSSSRARKATQFSALMGSKIILSRNSSDSAKIKVMNLFISDVYSARITIILLKYSLRIKNWINSLTASAA